MPKRLFSIFLIFITIFSFAGCSLRSPKKIEDVVKCSSNSYTCYFDGIKHDFIVELPDTNLSNAPLIIALHGYGNNASSMRLSTNLHEQANEAGICVVYVTGASNPDDAISALSWNSGIGDMSNNDVGFLVALKNYMAENFDTDSSNTFVVGFSNGAFMTHRIAVEASDEFKGIVSVAGMMPAKIWNEMNKDLSISVFQITGTKDEVIPQNLNNSASSSINPAIELVMDRYVELTKADLYATTDIGKNSVLNRYHSEASVEIWDLLIRDGYHSWPDENIAGFSINELIVDFINSCI